MITEVPDCTLVSSTSWIKEEEFSERDGRCQVLTGGFTEVSVCPERVLEAEGTMMFL